jgi:rod shape-determining protein MreC
VKQRAGSVLHLALPIKVWVQRFAFLILVALSIALLTMSRSDVALIQQLRVTVVDAVAPMLDLLSRPAAYGSAAVDGVRELVWMRSENARLRAENERLLQWQAVARRLEAENASLRDLLGFVPDPAATFVTARIIADPGGAYVRSLLVNAGSRAGIAKGQIAVAADGLVGRISEVGERSARVLLLTDLNSRIPVILESSRERAVLAGDNTDRPRLVHLPVSARLIPGDRVVTSGHGGVFPPGLPIGVVMAREGEPRVLPFVDTGRLEFLRIVDYGLEGLLLPQGKPVMAGRGGQEVEGAPISGGTDAARNARSTSATAMEGAP